MKQNSYLNLRCFSLQLLIVVEVFCHILRSVLKWQVLTPLYSTQCFSVLSCFLSLPPVALFSCCLLFPEFFPFLFECVILRCKTKTNYTLVALHMLQTIWLFVLLFFLTLFLDPFQIQNQVIAALHRVHTFLCTHAKINFYSVQLSSFSRLTLNKTLTSKGMKLQLKLKEVCVIEGWEHLTKNMRKTALNVFLFKK